MSIGTVTTTTPASEVARTTAYLAGQRADDAMHLPRLALAHYRGDGWTLERIAAELGIDVLQAESAIRRALEAEGRPWPARRNGLPDCLQRAPERVRLDGEQHAPAPRRLHVVR